MRVGVITGTATYALPGLEDGGEEIVATSHGDAAVTTGSLGGIEVLHISRHEGGHQRLSSAVAHRANISALAELEADCVVSVTVCGAVDPSLELGSLVVFDDLHFPANRLGDGSLCTLYPEPGDPRRGHWIFDRPFSDGVREALLEGALASGQPVRSSGVYGHVDGPRFNTRTEIAALAAAGVSAVSQTAGPETVLAGEAELPLGLIGYVTDYANGVGAEPTPVETLLRLIGESTAAFAKVLETALPKLAESPPAPSGVVYRFEG